MFKKARDVHDALLNPEVLKIGSAQACRSKNNSLVRVLIVAAAGNNSVDCLSLCFVKLLKVKRAGRKGVSHAC